jgi:hypothetical protein
LNPRHLDEVDRYGVARSNADPLGLTRKDRAVHPGAYRTVMEALPSVRGRFLATAQVPWCD